MSLLELEPTTRAPGLLDLVRDLPGEWTELSVSFADSTTEGALLTLAEKFLPFAEKLANFAVGDIVNEIIKRGWTYERLALRLRIPAQTLKNRARVSRAFPKYLRRASVTWSHCAMLSGLLTEDEKTKWLDRIEEGQWTCKELAKRLQAELKPDDETAIPLMLVDAGEEAPTPEPVASNPPREAVDQAMAALLDGGDTADPEISGFPDEEEPEEADALLTSTASANSVDLAADAPPNLDNFIAIDAEDLAALARSHSSVDRVREGIIQPPVLIGKHLFVETFRHSNPFGARCECLRVVEEEIFHNIVGIPLIPEVWFDLVQSGERAKTDYQNLRVVAPDKRVYVVLERVTMVHRQVAEATGKTAEKSTVEARPPVAETTPAADPDDALPAWRRNILDLVGEAWSKLHLATLTLKFDVPAGEALPPDQETKLTTAAGLVHDLLVALRPDPLADDEEEDEEPGEICPHCGEEDCDDTCTAAIVANSSERVLTPEGYPLAEFDDVDAALANSTSDLSKLQPGDPVLVRGNAQAPWAFGTFRGTHQSVNGETIYQAYAHYRIEQGWSSFWKENMLAVARESNAGPDWEDPTCVECNERRARPGLTTCGKCAGGEV